MTVLQDSHLRGMFENFMKNNYRFVWFGIETGFKLDIVNCELFVEGICYGQPWILRIIFFSACSYENFYFYMQVEKLKMIPDEMKVKELAHDIYDTFFTPEAEYEVNVDHYQLQEIKRVLATEPTRDMYDDVQAHVFIVIRMDCFPKFQTSPEFVAWHLAEYECLPPGVVEAPVSLAEVAESSTKKKKKKSGGNPFLSCVGKGRRGSVWAWAMVYDDVGSKEN